MNLSGKGRKFCPSSGAPFEGPLSVPEADGGTKSKGAERQQDSEALGELGKVQVPWRLFRGLMSPSLSPLGAVKHVYLLSIAEKCYGTRFLWKVPLAMASGPSARPVLRDRETVAIENSLTPIPYLLPSQAS